MSDNKTTGDKTLSVNTTKTLTLKRPVEQGTVRQSFSHGRTKAVVVETVKRRHGPGHGPGAGAAPAKEAAPAAAPAAARPQSPAPATTPASQAAAKLTADQQNARQAALLEAKRRAEESRAPSARAPEARPVEARAPEARPAEARPAEVSEPRQTDARPAEAPAAAPRAAEPRTTETRAPEARPAEAAQAPAAPPTPAPAAAAPAAPAAAAAPAPAPQPAAAAPAAAPPPAAAAPAPTAPPKAASPAAARAPEPASSRPAAERPASRPMAAEPRGGEARPAAGRYGEPRSTGYGEQRLPPRDGGFPDRGARPAASGEPRSTRMDPNPPPRRDGYGAPRPGGFESRGPRPDGDRPRPAGAAGGYESRGPRPEGDRGPRPGGYGDRPREGYGAPRPGGYPDRPAAREGFGAPRTGGFSGERAPQREGYGAPREGYGSPRPGGFGDRAPPREGGFGAPRPGGFGRPASPAGPARFGFSRPAAPIIDPVAPPGLEGRAATRNANISARQVGDEDETRRVTRRPGGGAAARPAAPAKPERAKGGDEKRRGRLTVTSATGGEEERVRSVAAFRRRVQRLNRGQDEPKEKIAREVIIPETITIQELANRMSERGVDVIRLLMRQGAMHKITDVIDADTAQIIAEEMGHTVKRVAEADVEEGLFDVPDDIDLMAERPPVVTIMGHVDHGKTSLLDAIRKTNVVSGEAGGITQHIGAYQVTSPLGGRITFIDTPGHAAFTAMRARGARVTDIVVLVVAANDSVMPQTVEAINHAKAAKVPMIVAINKVDLPDARPERVKTDLLQHSVQVESLGGEVLEVEVSAKTGFNLDKLLEVIQLQAEVLDLRANADRPAEGTVVEAKLDRGRGPVATVLVQRGTLVQGDIVVAGSEWGRVRALISDQGEQITYAGPSVPVEILGFSGTPDAGDRVAVVESEARAREVTDYRDRMKREKAAVRGAGTARSLLDMMSQLKQAGRKEFPLVIKGDVQGSVEAIIGSMEKLGNEEVGARIMHAAVGGITESDVTLANASGAVLIGFNVRAHKEAREAAERAGVEIRYYNIIYDLVDDVKLAMSGLLAPTLRETMLGNASILEVFNITKVGKVAGCVVTDGKVERGAKVRLIRDNVVIHEGTLKTLKRFKDEVKEVQTGQECGMAFENYEDMRQGDVIECFRVEEIKRSL